MFGDETERRDWTIGIIVTVLIIGGLYWIRSQSIDEKASSEEVTEAIAVSSPTYESAPKRASAQHEYVIETRARSPKTIARVFECDQAGQRVLSDQPCGARAAVRDIAAPNRMQPQNTSVLYDPPPRSIQVQRMRAAGQRPLASTRNSGRCAAIDREKERINARMRRPYGRWEGEHYRDRLRQLSEERWNLRC